jgi:hypothetical protein
MKTFRFKSQSGLVLIVAALLCLVGYVRADTNNPAGSPNKTVECGSTWNFDTPTSAGNCSAGNVTVTVLGTVTNNQNCATAITRTWQVSDACGNSVVCTQAVTVVDTKPPNVNCAPDKTVQCGSAWSFDPPTALDACCGTNVSIIVFRTMTNGGICPPTITRTWVVTDCCSNHVFCSQTVTTLDTIPPTLTCQPNKTVQQGTVFSFDSPTAQDNCCGTNVTINVLSTVTNAGPCGLNITRTWQGVDCCGNVSATCSQTVTISQKTPPQIASIYVPCGGSVITITFNQPVTAVSAQNPANYVINCGAGPIAVTQAALSAPQIVNVYLAQAVGNGCTITVGGIQDPCGNTMTPVTQPLQCTSVPCVSGSLGNEYWLTFPGNHAPDPTNQPQPQLFITGSPGTFGNVAIPGLATPFSQNFTIPISGDVTIPLPREADLGDANDFIQTNGVHVVASQPVAVYGLNYVHFSSDAYLGLSTASLGKAYRVLAYKNVFPDVPELAGSQFAIVATVNGTAVTIVPPADVGARAGGVPFNVTLMQGETYQLRQTNPFSDDLSGALLVADQPIAVFGSHPCATIPDTNVFFCDHLVEQLLPTDMWGTNYLTVSLTNRLRSDTFRIMALMTNTIVRTNGVALPAPLNQGEFAEIELARSSQITGNKPILVAQFANSSDYDGVTLSDPFMALVPPASLYATSYSIHAPTNFPSNYINVTVSVSGVSQLSLDGGAIPAGQFSTIPGSGYAAARISVSPGPHTLSSSSSPFGVIVYGWNRYEGYGYPAGFCSSTAATPPANFACPPTNMMLQVGANCTAAVPDLTTQVGNAGAAILITQSPPPGTLLGPGTYNITVTIVDQSGQQHVCVTSLTIFQNGASGLQCPANILANCTSSAGRVVTFQPTVCDPNFTLSCNPPSGSLFPPGVTTVTCTAAGPNSSQQCSFTVTVNCLVLNIVPLTPVSQALSWPGNGVLYQATNVSGPFHPVAGATSPYTNRVRGQGFFRIGIGP